MASTPSYSDNRKIQRVLPLLQGLEKKESDDYSPRVVSLGPYHHGKPELAFVEAFKPTVVDMFISGGSENRDFYYYSVYDIIEDIKSCYEFIAADQNESAPKYLDDKLAEMFLFDASLVIILMLHTASGSMKVDEQIAEKAGLMMEHLGSLIMQNLMSDIRLLENQIPLFLIKFLVRLRYGTGKDDELLSSAGEKRNDMCLLYMIPSFFGDFPRESLLQEFEKEKPLHLLEATHRLLFSSSGHPEKTSTFRRRWFPCSGADKEKDLETGGMNEGNKYHFSSIFASVGKLLGCRKSVAEDDIQNYVPSFRSATDLKAKGIYFRACASSSRSLKDFSFRPHFFYSRLQLPRVIISTSTKVWWKNMIAYEVGPGTRANGLHLLSYISFMKSLIQTTEDVKELRETKVLCNLLDSDDEVLDVFRDINAHWMGALLLKDVHKQIQAHCSSTAKNWMAELVHANFQSPWKLIAFIAAVALLGISAGQLYYAVHPN